MASLRLGKIAGIPIELHSTFLLFFVGLAALLAVFDPANLIPLLAMFVMLFVSVLIHELFHSVAAIAKGSKVERILLLPIGGISMASSLPEKPSGEFLVAVAGPAFNFGVAAVLLLIAYAVPGLPWPWQLLASEDAAAFEQAVLQYPLYGLFYINLVLGAFNLLPAFPMDGGRMLRAALASFLGFSRATRIATRIGRFLAFMLAAAGLFYNWVLIIIAFFVYVGANQEYNAIMVRDALRGFKVRDAMSAPSILLDSEMSLDTAISAMERSKSASALVLLGNGYGFVDTGLFEQVKRELRASKRLADVAIRVPAASADAPLAGVFITMLAKGITLLPVVENSVLIGVLDESEINKLYKLHRLHSD